MLNFRGVVKQINLKKILEKSNSCHITMSFPGGSFHLNCGDKIYLNSGWVMNLSE